MEGSPKLRGRRMATRISRLLILSALSSIPVLFLSACGEERRGPPDIVLIVLDTVRRDHLSTYGYSRETSPRLSELRDDGRLYTNAYATGSWTVPSHASIFTGLYSVRHGATQERQELKTSFETLAEILRAAGYETIGVTGNAAITEARGFSQGFEIYRQTWMRDRKQDRDLTTLACVERLLRKRDGDRPLFLFVNLIGAHTPFDSCGDHCGAFGETLAGGPIDSEWADYYRGFRDFTPSEIDRLIRLYDAEIKQVDAILGRILTAIDRHLPPETTFIAVTSDHGENIGDHGHMTHVFSLHESTIQIPLIIRHPPLVPAGSTEEHPVQLVDIFPTILRVAEVAGADIQHHGIDLFSELESDRPVLSEYYRPDQAIGRMYASASPQVKKRLDPYRRRIRSVIEDDWKFVWGSDGRHELYDLRTDPHERLNLIDNEAVTERARVLQATMKALLARYAEGGEPPEAPGELSEFPPLDAETEAELRELGYLD